jgi:hypothetical protein
MAKFLAVQIQLGRITIDDVPERHREAVEAELSVN